MLAYRLKASTGQASMQAPQSMQESASTEALPSTMLIALLGHSSTQDSQPVHLLLSTSAGIYNPFQNNRELRIVLKRERHNNESFRNYNRKIAKFTDR
jgi:hypothetical protein